MTASGRVLRAGPFSARLRPRAALVPLAAAALLVLLAALALGRGGYPMSVPEVLRALAGAGDEAERFVVLELRAPRVAVGLLVGAALGLSGALVQTVARNPLAAPDVLGVTQGASAGAVAALLLGGGTAAGSLLGGLGVPLAALLGGLLTGGLLAGLAWRSGLDGQRLVLVGIGLWALSSAVTDWLLTRADIRDAAGAYVWLTGSLNGRGWEQAGPLAAALVVLVPAALAATRALDGLQLGPDTARALGVRVAATQGAVLLVAVGLAAFAVSAAGPVGFVALVVPQVAVRLTGGSRPPLVASALVGAVLVVGADLVARTVLPEALPVGILTAAIGAPYLLWLLVRRRRSTA